MSYEQRVIIQFLPKEKVPQPKFTEDLQRSMALKPTVFEASNTGVNSSTAGAKTYPMIRGPEDPRLIISTPKLSIACLERESFSSAYSLAGNRLDSLTQFAGNEKFSSPLGLTPVGRRPTSSEGRKMR
jgi:hypothetical protein